MIFDNFSPVPKQACGRVGRQAAAGGRRASSTSTGFFHLQSSHSLFLLHSFVFAVFVKGISALAYAFYASAKWIVQFQQYGYLWRCFASVRCLIISRDICALASSTDGKSSLSVNLTRTSFALIPAHLATENTSQR